MDTVTGTESGARGRALALYHEAFRECGPACLWNLVPAAVPDTDSIRNAARRLRLYGWKKEYALARKMEAACDAIDRNAVQDTRSHRGEPES